MAMDTMSWRTRANWWRRLFATLFAFVLFGAAGLLFKLILLPYTLISTAGNVPRQLRARRLVAGIWRLFVVYLVKSGILSYELHGAERLGRPGQLLLANHPSLLDVVFLLSFVPQTNCVVKRDLLRNLVMTSPIRACGFVVNDESEALLSQIHAILQGGQCLLIFPEGTRTNWDGVVRFHRGAVSLGLRSARIITPIVIKQNPPSLKKGQPWYRIPRIQMHYEFRVGEDIDPQAWLAEKPLPIASRRLNQYLEDYFNKETAA
nr:lysophospholipid acyltransferase family protein [Stenoxybacter acetivorans]